MVSREGGTEEKKATLKITTTSSTQAFVNSVLFRG